MEKSKKTGLYVLGAFIVLLLIFSFTDLSISQTLFNRENKFAKFFGYWGGMPALYVGMFSSAALIWTRPTDKKWKSVLNIVVFGAFLYYYCNLGAISPIAGMKFADETKTVLGWVTTVIYIVLFLGISYLAYRSNPEGLRKAAVIGLLLALATRICFEFLKTIWGRPRFRAMQDPVNEFKAWYQPQGIVSDDAFKSFPSGHSANAAGSIWLLTLPGFVNKCKGKEGILLTISLLWTGCTMLARIIVGAHFASDVLFGAFMTMGLFQLITYAVNRYYEKR